MNGADPKPTTIMSKMAAEKQKRIRTYSVDDEKYATASDGGHDDAEPAASAVSGDGKPAEVVPLSKTSHSSLHNKLLDVEHGAASRSRQASFSMSASQRSIARRQAAANPFARAVSQFI